MIAMKNIPDIAWYNIAVAMRDIGYPISPDDYAAEMQYLIKRARLNPSEFRNARAQFRHNRDMNIKTESYKKLISYLQKLEVKYGRRSLPFQTLLEAVSAVTMTRDQVNRIYAKKKHVPAYDDTIRSPYSGEPTGDRETDRYALSGKARRNEVLEWLKGTEDPVIAHIRNMFAYFKESSRKEGSYIKYYTVSNGSTSGISVRGRNLLDIEAQCFRFDDLIAEYSRCCQYFGIANTDPEWDDRVYLILQNQWKGCHGRHMVVPDKDGKIREVFYLLAFLQAFSKGIHKKTDPWMKKCPGNYTFHQKDWVETIIENAWQLMYLIITVDMEKFSDTIIRKYLLDALKALGMPESVARECDELWSYPIYDVVLKESLGVHQVILQGQYSIFPIMTILNICLQRFTIVKWNRPWSTGKFYKENNHLFSAALGDDTGMVFIDGDFDTIFEDIRVTYGSFGMVINELKTDHIHKGVGQGDFAKVTFDSLGIIDHLNPKNVEKHNLDGIITDILNLSLPLDKKRLFLTSLFGETAANSIMGLSIINGGPSDHVILQEDVNLYVNNLKRVNLVLKDKESNEEEADLRMIKGLYEELGYQLINSPLLYHLSSDQLSTMKEIPDDQKDEYLITCILNMDTVGADINISELYNAVGYQPSDLKTKYADWEPGQPETREYQIWNEFTKFDSFAAKRKMGEKGRFSSIYAPCIRGDIELLSQTIQSDTLIKSITGIRSVVDYEREATKYRIIKVRSVLSSNGIYLEPCIICGNSLCWIHFYDEHQARITRRLHAVWNDNRATHPLLSKEEYDAYLATHLKVSGIEKSYSEFMEEVTIYRKKVHGIL